MKKIQNRLYEYSLSAVALATGAAFLPQQAQAAVITFADSGSFVEGTVDDGDQAVIAINLPDGSQLLLDDDFSSDDFTLNLSLGGLWDNNGTAGISKYGIPRVLAAGAAINPSSVSAVPHKASIVDFGTAQGDWASAFTDQYIGFQTSMGNEGYLKVSWNPGAGLFSYNGGAIENTGGDILSSEGESGSVPAPTALALLCAGAVGLARQRKQR